jgi:hypothetical protein
MFPYNFCTKGSLHCWHVKSANFSTIPGSYRYPDIIYPKTDWKIPLKFKLGQRTDDHDAFSCNFKKISDIDVSVYFSRNAGNAEHSESNTRSVMKSPKIIRKYPKALSFILRCLGAAFLCCRCFSSRTTKDHLLDIFQPTAEHSESSTRNVMKSMLERGYWTLPTCRFFLLATNACNYLLYEACNKNKNQQIKHFQQFNQIIWLVCYHMIIGDRSIDNILRGFLSFTNLSNSENRH